MTNDLSHNNEVVIWAIPLLCNWLMSTSTFKTVTKDCYDFVEFLTKTGKTHKITGITNARSLMSKWHILQIDAYLVQIWSYNSLEKNLTYQLFSAAPNYPNRRHTLPLFSPRDFVFWRHCWLHSSSHCWERCWHCCYYWEMTLLQGILVEMSYSSDVTLSREETTSPWMWRRLWRRFPCRRLHPRNQRRHRILGRRRHYPRIRVVVAGLSPHPPCLLRKCFLASE